MRHNFSLELYKAHPDWKVETKTGTPVTILVTDMRGPHPIGGLVHYRDHDSFYYWNADDGTQYHGRETDCDIFLVEPEPELTEFEYAMLRYLQDAANKKDDAEIEKVTRLYSKELLNLACKCKEVESVLKEKVLHDYWRQAADLQRQAKEEGRAEALKDLPKWRKWSNGAYGNGEGIPLAIVRRGLNGYELVDALGIPGEQYIMLSDLEKLPGFKVD